MTCTCTYIHLHKDLEIHRFRYEVEPGFFIGAMFVSYAFGIAVIVVVFTAVNILVDDAGIATYLGVIFTGVLLSMPWSFRDSRVLMLYWFRGVEYREQSSASSHR